MVVSLASPTMSFQNTLSLSLDSPTHALCMVGMEITLDISG